MSGYDFQSIRCLLVDDNDHMRKLIKTILQPLGMNMIREAHDGAQAIAMLREFDADLCIVDWMMEPMDGVAFTRLVRTAPDSPNPYLPIIMLTGHTEMGRIVDARDAGVTEFLAKPVRAGTVYKRIADVIEEPRKFIATQHFIGPDRRRRANEWEGDDRRVSL